jgi:hypothetical protein
MWLTCEFCSYMHFKIIALGSSYFPVMDPRGSLSSEELATGLYSLTTQGSVQHCFIVTDSFFI